MKPLTIAVFILLSAVIIGVAFGDMDVNTKDVEQDTVTDDENESEDDNVAVTRCYPGRKPKSRCYCHTRKQCEGINGVPCRRGGRKCSSSGRICCCEKKFWIRRCGRN